MNARPTSQLSTLSLHGALPIYSHCTGSGLFRVGCLQLLRGDRDAARARFVDSLGFLQRSEEHTSELQSLRHLVCRLLLEKKTKPSTDTATDNANKNNPSTPTIR